MPLYFKVNQRDFTTELRRLLQSNYEDPFKTLTILEKEKPQVMAKIKSNILNA